MRKRNPRKKNIVSRYINERHAWTAAGKPMRSDEEVERIFAEECRPCEHFRKFGKSSGRCGLCGCAINIGKSTNFNKLRWATTKCPADPPKWTAEVEPPKAEKAKTEEAKTPSKPEAKADPVKKKPSRKERLEERRKAREARRESRQQRQLEKELKLGKMPEQTKVKRGTDPLLITTRYLEPAEHVLRDLWKHCPAFLVCGGPSINAIDIGLLRHPAICSMGVNNVAGYAPVKSFVFSDPIEKFHHGIFLNPGIMKFAPHKKLNHRVRAKKPDGTFEFTTLRGGDFPNIFGFKRNSAWKPKAFLTSKEASWGCGKVCASQTGRENVLFTPLLGIRLLHYLGVSRIYLLGVDFNMASGETGGYAFNQGRTPGAASSNNVHYKRVSSMLEEIKPVLAADGMTILNCNPDSHCSAFDYYPYEDAVADCLSLMPPEPYDLSQWYEKDMRKPTMDDDDEEHRE